MEFSENKNFRPCYLRSTMITGFVTSAVLTASGFDSRNGFSTHAIDFFSSERRTSLASTARIWKDMRVSIQHANSVALYCGNGARYDGVLKKTYSMISDKTSKASPRHFRADRSLFLV